MKKEPVLKLSEKLNPRKRRVDTNTHVALEQKQKKPIRASPPGDRPKPPKDKKIEDSNNKRLESLRKKRLDYREQKLIIKSGLGGVVSNFDLTLAVCITYALI